MLELYVIFKKLAWHKFVSKNILKLNSLSPCLGDRVIFNNYLQSEFIFFNYRVVQLICTVIKILETGIRQSWDSLQRTVTMGKLFSFPKPHL